MLRKLIVTGLAFTLVGTASAEAAVKAGTYNGKTQQNAKVSLRVLASRKAVVKYTIAGAALQCSDGRNRQLAGFATGASSRMRISSKGLFGLMFSSADDSVAVDLKGKIRSPRASGTIRIAAAFNDQGQQDPNGSITCASGGVRWSAKQP